ncbi:hypothetical protein [Pallidibacillus pasinlerensis]|uniref:hypothetical protein n=1 Tax=Pallidibacillus pasinlerensis TaxID=2703818 RepID=UPI0038990CD0
MSKIIMNVKKRANFWLGKYLSGDSIHFKEVISIIIPILVDQAFLILMILFNTAMISSSGTEAVSAVNMVDSLR